jgi:hypothetical protein
MNPDLVRLASEANEATLNFRSIIETDDSKISVGVWFSIKDLMSAIDALTGAIVEEANR